MKKLVLYFIVPIIFLVNISLARPSEEIAAISLIIEKRAKSICTEVEQNGNKKSLDLELGIAAQLYALIKSVAGLDVSASAGLNTEDYNGVSREVLHVAIQNVLKCRQNVVSQLVDLIRHMRNEANQLATASTELPVPLICYRTDGYVVDKITRERTIDKTTGKPRPHPHKYCFRFFADAMCQIFHTNLSGNETDSVEFKIGECQPKHAEFVEYREGSKFWSTTNMYFKDGFVTGNFEAKGDIFGEIEGEKIN